jgi:hypothetical protein
VHELRLTRRRFSFLDRCHESVTRARRERRFKAMTDSKHSKHSKHSNRETVTAGTPAKPRPAGLQRTGSVARGLNQ